jgi:2-polyprenyl-3-methyl-5-hydroxy-6-metoxy-1,4-benzoquinol methylase
METSLPLTATQAPPLADRVDQSAPSPALFMRAVGGYQQSAAVKAAIELDLFTAIAEGAGDVAEIADRCQASTRGTRILADYLTVAGFLVKENGRYALTHDSFVFLNRRSPAYLGSAVDFLLNPVNVDAFRHLAAVVRKGTGETNHMVPDNQAWVTFARSMAPVMALPAQLVADALDVRHAGPMRVLDVAAGHGLFGIAIAQQNPAAAVVALDWAPVLDVALQNAASSGVSARYETMAGDALGGDLGTGYDLVLVTNFLHHFDKPTCVSFLRRAHEALKPGGRAAVLEFVPDENRVQPPQAAAFPMMMLALTPSGDAYTFSEHRAMLEEAGFGSISMDEIPPMQRMITARR